MKRIVSIMLLVAGGVIASFLWKANHRSSDREASLDLAPGPVEQPEERQFSQDFASSTEHTDPVPPDSHWSLLESGNMAQFIASLREIGCPEHIIRSIVTFHICREYRGRLVDLETEWSRSWDYAQHVDYHTTRERQQLRDQLSREMDRELQALFDVSAEGLKEDAAGWRIVNPTDDYLPLSKRAQVLDVESYYRKLINEARGGLIIGEGESEPVVETRVTILHQQKREQLAALLSPLEFEMYQVRNSPAAQYVRRYLPEAESEAEFQKMVQAASEFGMTPEMVPKQNSLPYRYGMRHGTPAAAAQDSEFAARQAQLEARLKELLGENRYHELKLGPGGKF
jgi:hypothetical protein